MEKIYLTLTPEERIELLRYHKDNRDGIIRDRVKAVLLYNDGYNYTQISKILLINDDTAKRYIV